MEQRTKVRMQNHKRAVFIGPVPMQSEKELLKTLSADLWIAVDGGISYFAEINRIPDLWIGDMDSFDREGMDEAFLKQIPEHVIRKVPVIKDDTDMALALEAAFEMGCDEALLYGGSKGERISHMLANIQLMHAYEKKGFHIRMMGANHQMEVLYQGKKMFSDAMKGSLSVIALTDEASGVSIEGMQYEFEGTLTNERTLGISNSFVGRDASVAVKEGALLLVYENV